MDLINQIDSEFPHRRTFAEAIGMKYNQVRQWHKVPEGRVKQVERFLALWRENRRLSENLSRLEG